MMITFETSQRLDKRRNHLKRAFSSLRALNMVDDPIIDDHAMKIADQLHVLYKQHTDECVEYYSGNLITPMELASFLMIH